MSDRDTKTRILDAAERLFAEKGIDGASLRAVTREAGVNLAAVHYHLGGKDGLLAAVIDRRVAPVNAERLKRLNHLEGRAQGEAIAVDELIRAFVEPALRIVTSEERGILVARALCRLYFEAGDTFREILMNQFREVAERYIAALIHSLRPLPPHEVVRRFQYVVGVLIHELADPHRIRSSGFPIELPEDDPATRLERMVSFLSAGVRAPYPHSGAPAVGGSS